MKKRIFATLLAVMMLLSVLGTSAAAVTMSNSIDDICEMTSEELATYLSALNADELNGLIYDLHLKEISGNLSAMSAAELNDFIHSLYLQSLSLDKDSATKQGDRALSIRAAWLAAAELAQVLGYPCAGTIVSSAVWGQDYIESNGLLADTIETTNAFAAWRFTAASTPEETIAFEKSDNSDLFYAIHLANIELTASPSYARARITDVFDFEFEMDMQDLFSTIVNDWAWLCQYTNNLSVIDVQIDITW